MEHDQDQEALFHSYPFAYYVQSPSTISHANSADIRNTIPESEFQSPTRPEPTNPTLHEEASRFTLSHYSSSRGSSHSFLHQKKISYDARSNGTGTENGVNRLIIVDGGGKGDDGGDEDDDEEYYYGVRKTSRWWKTYCSYRNSDSCVWICMQISWRAMLSLCIALLVFYIATKPPPPKVSIKMAGIGEFGLGEGVDGSGVTTKILTCNCSINLIIDNKSKLFGLHIHPPTIQMRFGRLPFALSHGPKLYAAESGSSKFKLYAGTRNKPMYGAGRSMEDMLESGKGLPLVLRVSLRSSFHVVWNLIKPKFHHQAECLLVLHRAYDKKHRTQTYNSTCIMT
ncbi:PREDICTED: Late embryogenesis abundant [Prunus dulcis]|uniref:PREDICTED: Late embryogenesis abundant n=1 Tax=Prunus dulcis TaxID=3755 RepID=A0A5E4G2Z7_PRUDU|nr:uncharacterized protein LOC117617324 [Prunus dulcis]KAI5341741.1 hypothetical protein L3X38_009616 [Prunus dulcis]VVA33982.1 PREDICTED: Late embryogenesis abundant [Prunus dulcis]